MASNPMQRKSRLSFLIGMILALVIMGTGTGFMYMNMSKTIKDKDAELQHFSKTVYVFSQDVKAGQVIDMGMLKSQPIDDRIIPSTATSDASTIQGYTLTDKSGNPIVMETKNDDKEVNVTYRLNDGSNGKEGRELQISDVEDAQGNSIFYYEENGEKIPVETAQDPLIAKVDIKANTVFTFDMVARGSETLTNDARWQEYNSITLPSDLVSGDTVDIRLQMPSGEDFIVLSKKKVLFPGAEDEGSAPTSISDVLKLSVDEAETLTMSSAIVDSYQILGSKLYAVKYTEPGIQNAATGTYSPSGSTIQLINSDPNIVARAMEELRKRENSANSNKLREDFINPAIESSGMEGQENLKTKQQESITKSQTTRQTYLQELGS